MNTDLAEAVRAFITAERAVKEAHDSWNDRDAPRLREEMRQAKERMILLAFTA